MPPSSVSSKHADDENSTRGRSSPKPSQTPEGAFRPQCCLLLCRQPDKGKVNDYEYARTSYTDFASQGTKMRELYSDLAKACFKPIELTMPNMQGTK